MQAPTRPRTNSNTQCQALQMLNLDNTYNPIVVVLTRSSPKAREENKSSARDAFAEAKRRFGKFLLFDDDPLFVDARTSWTMEMKNLRHVLNLHKKRILQDAPNQPALCDDIERALPWICKKTKTPTILQNELLDKVARGLKSSTKRKFDKNVVLSHAGLLDAALRQMSDACDILSFQKHELKDILVIDPSWLLHDVIGVLMSPEKFPTPTCHVQTWTSQSTRSRKGFGFEVLRTKQNLFK